MAKAQIPSIRKVIDGKVFDTATAEHICPITMVGGSLHHDHECERTDLYRSPKGQFFIAGEGGAASRWRRKTHDGCVAGEGIQLLTDDEARSLMESVDGPVEDYFEVEEG